MRYNKHLHGSHTRRTKATQFGSIAFLTVSLLGYVNSLVICIIVVYLLGYLSDIQEHICIRSLNGMAKRKSAFFNSNRQRMGLQTMLSLSTIRTFQSNTGSLEKVGLESVK